MADNLLIGKGLKQYIDTPPTKEEIGSMPLLDVNALRSRFSPDDPIQETLGSREHFLFMEDVIRQNPTVAPLATAMTVGYQAVKSTEAGRELVKTTGEKASPASVEQLKGGLGGIASGLGLAVGDTLLEWMGVNTTPKETK